MSLFSGRTGLIKIGSTTMDGSMYSQISDWVIEALMIESHPCQDSDVDSVSVDVMAAAIVGVASFKL